MRNAYNDIGEARVAIVTGASSGFGMLTAVELAKDGYVVVAAMRDPERRGAALREAADRAFVAGRVIPTRLDVTDCVRIEEVVADTAARYGRIDVLVNNAGYAQGGFAEDVPLAQVRAQFETNVFGAIAMMKAVAPHMRARGSGNIVNMSSVSGRLGMPGFAPYAASKFALEGFSEALRLELRPFGVFVVLVEPGSYRTNIWEKGFAAMAGDEHSPYADALGRVRSMAESSARNGGDPMDVARLVVRIANARAPRLRYVLPLGAVGMVALRSLLPWSWYEAAVFRLLSILR
ncbi:SDR family oxidoreductase [Paenibacillus sp.]|uniref:SDR family oxidoreductase n=1 Tax=Paenibacillus sp. TaxID=58172 RepID=UPI002D656236|nr:SDR family oxidoreductase [Paenibacillus sp.]HZG57086.1 SDR family oxidoreductase [Paenibacillus sp.]